jgi:hypothetical protein
MYKRVIETYVNNSSNYIIAMFLTGGLCGEAANLIYTLKKLNLHHKLIVTCLDKEAEGCIKALGVKTRYKDLELAKEASFGTKDFLEITRQKLVMMDDLLNEYSLPILYTDTDIVFLKNIDKYIIENLNKNDITFQSDSRNFDYTLNNVCTGFVLYNNNTKTKNFIIKAKEIMSDPNKLNWKPGDLADQKATNMALKEVKDIKVGLFDNYNFPNGARYFDNIDTVYKDYTPVIVHNNFIKGLDNKIQRFKKHSLWFV